MANICSNHFYFSCEHNAKKYIEHFVQNIPDFEYQFIDGENIEGFDKCIIEGSFDSRWVFPMDKFDTILINYGNLGTNDPDECYFRCLSEEYGQGYVAMNIYQKGNWEYEQCFDI